LQGNHYITFIKRQELRAAWINLYNYRSRANFFSFVFRISQSG